MSDLEKPFDELDREGGLLSPRIGFSEVLSMEHMKPFASTKEALEEVSKPVDRKCLY